MTIQEAKVILRIDDDNNMENDRLQATIDILPHFIYERTGYPVDKQASEPLCQLLEQFLIRRFYYPDEVYGHIDRTIDSLLVTLKFKAMQFETAGEQ